MSYEISLNKRSKKFLDKLAKSAPREYLKITIFLEDELPKCKNPCTLPNAKHLQGFSNNKWRWRIGEYRIIGNVCDGAFQIIEIIKIAKRDDSTYKGL